ncbi:MAG: phage tail sheath C-terminal domain-containing protein [Methylobacter sp.]
MQATSRLPGIRIAVTPPPLAEVLPRMDVAVFVGFAAMGPTHCPVAIESVSDYVRIFGNDIPLAWNDEQREWVYAHLAATVRGFFANGGLRCWVIRVSRTLLLEECWRKKVPLKDDNPVASANCFNVPGVLIYSSSKDSSSKTLKPALVQASSIGSWSDGLKLQTALSVKNFELKDCGYIISLPSDRIEFRTSEPLHPGDLIELGDSSVSNNPRIRRYAIIDTATPLIESGVQIRKVSATLCAAFEPVHVDKDSPALIEQGEAEVIGLKNSILAARLEIGSGNKLMAKIIFTGDKPAGIERGQWLRWIDGNKTVWLKINSLGHSASKVNQNVSDFVAEGLAWQEQTPLLLGSLPTRASSLTLDMKVINGQDNSILLSGIGLTPLNRAGWWRHLSDDLFYGRSNFKPISQSITERIEDQSRFPLAALDNEINALNENQVSFPLAWIPLGVSAFFDTDSGPLPQQATALERDGLSIFNEELFLDPALDELGVNSLIGQAEFIRNFSDPPRELFGIHAALSIGVDGLFNEASLITVPDAVHVGWKRHVDKDMASIKDDKPGPDEKRIQNKRSCAYLLDQIVNGEQKKLGGFFRCETDVPRSRPTEDKNEDKKVLWIQLPAKEFTAHGEQSLFKTHRALLHLAAASGEFFAVLSLPKHYQVNDSLRYAARLRAQQDRSNTANLSQSDYIERRALSFGALYHPWVVSAAQPSAVSINLANQVANFNIPNSFFVSENKQWVCPPDGSITGILAARAAGRGAWIAPANQLMTGVLALTPQIQEDAWDSLQEAQVNLLRTDARGFISLSADTLSDDPDLRPINVRRLLILLRRAALRRGTSYVFEPNDEVLRRAVERGFTFLLMDLFRFGAFAGATSAESFRVITQHTINTNADRNAGRFFVELRVAPSLPLKFLTIRMTQIGEKFTILEGA